MHGVVSLLDDEHYRIIEGVWEELSQNFGVRGIYSTPFPHFTYQVSEVYDLDRVETGLKRIASEMQPFNVRTGGLGVFTASKPVLYVPIVRSPELNELHERVWTEVGQVTVGEATRYYESGMWLPHVTLAQGDIDCASLAEIMSVLAARNFHWEMEVNNLSLIYDVGAEQGLRCRFNFNNGRKQPS
jgi:2'-5' RNA ligase